MIQAELLETLNKLPEPLQQEVLHYAEFLAEKYVDDVPEVASSEKEFDSLPSEEISIEGASEKRGAFGILKGKIKISDDFDDPLEDFKEYME
jgi:Protein of unknown function (DUF2281)